MEPALAASYERTKECLKKHSYAGALMRNTNTLSRDFISAGQRCLLADDIAAIEEIASRGEPGLSPMSRIPEGAEIEYCGAGFNDQTLKIRWRGKFYFVFREDLSAQRKTAAQCACC